MTASHSEPAPTQDKPIPDRTRNWEWMHSQWTGLLVVAVVFILMAALSWRKWTDIVIDSGNQLYVPWRLSVGDVLYRDVMYLPGGPFSQYFNALLFRIFGVSFTTLIWANLAFAAGILVLIYRRFLRAADSWTATTICLAIVLIFAFGRFDPGNYTYVAPYSHEVLHGLILSIIVLAFLSDRVAADRQRDALLSGLGYGLVFLTKPDIFLALSGSLMAAIFLLKKNGGSLLKFLLVFGTAALAGPLCFLAYFLRHENLAASFQSVAFAWGPLLTKDVAGDYFYKCCLGLDHPGMNLMWMLIWFSGASLFLALCLLSSWYKPSSLPGKVALMTMGLLTVMVAGQIIWLGVGYLLPPLCLISCLALCVGWRNQPGRHTLVFPLLWSAFALILLSKMGVFCRIWNYGFALAMPAFVSAVYLLLWLLPLWLEKWGINRRLFRWLVWATLMCGCFQLARQSVSNYQEINYPVGGGGDEVKTADTTSDHRGPGIETAISWINTHIPPRATLVVVPEGSIINYLTQRVNPTGYPVWMPPEIKAFGQTNMEIAFEQHSPDYVILLHRSSEEYGVRYFGQQPGFGLALIQWIEKNYTPVKLIGSEPLKNDLFGIKILKRNSAAPPQNGIENHPPPA